MYCPDPPSCPCDHTLDLSHYNRSPPRTTELAKGIPPLRVPMPLAVVGRLESSASLHGFPSHLNCLSPPLLLILSRLALCTSRMTLPHPVPSCWLGTAHRSRSAA
eukprot:GGOE01047249.1.p2 GENE.GGOE01047249.1~~GGOE01047249.1.p2  ORF type:complete len:105 (-),score=0.98 GGOE01047249.1:209-523(-)